MFEKVFESFRKTADWSMKTQQDVFKHWGQSWPWTTPNAFGSGTDWSETARRRWLEAVTEALNHHRELVDSTYKSGIQLIEQSFRATSAQSPQDFQRMVEDLWHKLSDGFKEQTEAQIREFQKAAEKWSPEAQKAKT
jgi:hypothetical protein